MYNLYQWYVRFKQYAAFSKSEKQWLVISVFVMTLIVAFNDGSDTFEWNSWLMNFLIVFICIAIAVFVREFVHRLWGIEQGYRVEFKPLFYGLVGGLVIAFMTNGFVRIPIYGGVMLHIMEKHRLGYFRYRLGYQHLGSTSVMASLSNLLLAFIVKLLPFIPAEFAEKFIWINVLMAVVNMLPIPTLDGANVLYASRKLWFFSFGGILGAGALLVFSANINVLWALAVGILTAIMFLFTLVFGFKSS
ncbi:MAG: hypothetical protein GY861_09815 [bacterium]|nr:hypothetical protein [bacterium]